MSHHHHRARFREDRLAVLDIETISGEEMPDGAFPPWCTHTPVIASLLTADRNSDGLWSFSLTSVDFSIDDQPLTRIEELVAGRSIATFGGRHFDLPVLMLTAQKMRSFALPALGRAAREPRFHSAFHYDLADRYSAYGSARGASLERLCGALGIAAKLDVHGSEVGQLYDQGRVDEIARYCEGDVASTLLLLANQRAIETGDSVYHASLTYQFVRWLQSQGLDHLQPFTEVHDLDELLTQSLLGQFEAAFECARIDAELKEKLRIDASFTETIRY